MTWYNFKRIIVRLQSLWSVAANGYSTLTGFILLILSSRILSNEDFGIWVFFLTVSTLFDMFKTGLIFPGYLKQSAGTSNKTKRFVFNTSTGFLIIVVLAQFIICWSISLLSDESNSWHFFATYYPLLAVSNFFIMLSEWWWQSNNRFQNILIIRLINRTAIIVSCFIWLVNKQDLIHILIMSNIFTSVVIAGFRWLPKFSFNDCSKAVAGKLTWFALYATPAQVMSNLLKSSNMFIINRFLGNVATGTYGFAARFIEMIELPIRSMGAVHYNHFASVIRNGNSRAAFHLTLRYLMKSTLSILPLVLLLIVMAPYLVNWISDGQNIESISILRVMAIYCLFLPADRYFGLFLEAIGRPDLNLIKVGFMLLINVIVALATIFLFKSVLAITLTSIFTFGFGVLFGGCLIIFKALPQNITEVQTIKLELANE